MPADVLALFDLDHTLVPWDSEASWVEFLMAEGHLDRAEVAARSRDLTERYNRGEAGSIEFSEFYLGLLVPLPPAELPQWRQRWIDEWLRPRIRPSARDLVARHRAAGDRVVVTTAVFRWLAEPEAAEFDVDELLATEAEVVGDRFTGRVLGLPNSREGKVERLRAWLAEEGRRLDHYREVIVYADSVNDLPLLSHATRPIVVNADPLLAAHARHAGWDILSLD